MQETEDTGQRVRGDARTCGAALTLDGDAAAEFAAAHTAGAFTRRGADGALWCVRVPACADPPAPQLPAQAVLPLRGAAGGSAHLCVVDSVGQMFCIGASTQCQFIRTDAGPAGVWQAAWLPWRAERVWAAADTTCVDDGARVFCTGCVEAACVCRHRTTLSMAGVTRVSVTASGSCVTAASGVTCIGTRGAAVGPACRADGAVVVCGPRTMRLPHTVRVVAGGGAFVVAATATEVCVSATALRSITCHAA